MMTLAVDIETYSSVDLMDSGVYAYAEAPDFTILLFGFAYDGDPVEVIDLAAGEQLPDDIVFDLTNPKILKTAYNANFERTCLAAYLHKSMDPDQWQCSAVMAAEMGLPRSLGAVGKALGLPEDEQKDKQGKALIQYFSKPCKPTKSNGGRTRNLPLHDPAKWALYKAYNAQDVEVERRIRERLQRTHPVADSEWELWRLDQRINDRGVGVDLQLVRNAIDCDARYQEINGARALKLTGVDNPKSVAQIKSWIAKREGITDTISLDKEHIGALRDRCKDPDVLAYLDMRGDLAKSSVAKYYALDRAACEDSRIRGTLMFYGANRSGRWAGRIFQPQNLRQNHLRDLDLARKLLSNGEYDMLDMLFGSAADTLSQLIRTAIVPAKGRRFLVADFSAIEARVIAWLARETWRLDVFRTHGKIYEASASQMFRVPVDSIHKGDPLRQKGKVAELALGYGGGPGALIAMGALKMGLQEDELPKIVKLWRSASPKIVEYWWAIDAMVREAIESPGKRSTVRNVSAVVQGDVMYLRLPGGRDLAYISPRIEDNPARGNDKITYLGVGTAGSWGRIDTYGPKLVENIVQATARDCLANAMLNLDKAGYEIVFHVHDECIADTAAGSVEEMSEIMCRPAPWMAGLPLRADGYARDYYRKD